MPRKKLQENLQKASKMRVDITAQIWTPKTGISSFQVNRIISRGLRVVLGGVRCPGHILKFLGVGGWGPHFLKKLKMIKWYGLLFQFQNNHKSTDTSNHNSGGLSSPKFSSKNFKNTWICGVKGTFEKVKIKNHF